MAFFRYGYPSKPRDIVPDTNRAIYEEVPE